MACEVEVVIDGPQEKVFDVATIAYTFIGKGDATSFRRVFELGSELGAQQPLPYTSDTARAENAYVKALVEKILWREHKGRNLP